VTTPFDAEWLEYDDARRGSMERVEWEGDPEELEMQVANEIGPQIIGQNMLVGARLVGMRSEQGVQTLVFDNGITATIKGSFKLSKSEYEDLGGGEKKELTGQSIHDHFKEIEEGKKQPEIDG